MKSRHILAILFLLQTAGCGDGAIRVSGQVTMNGQPFSPADGQVIKVVLRPFDSTTANELSPPQKAALIASVAKSGEFVFAAVLPGKYVVTASDFDRLPSTDRLADHFRQAPRDIICDISHNTSSPTLALEKAWFQESRRR